MRDTLFIAFGALIICASACSSTTVTRRQLVERMGTSFPYAGSHLPYMGSKDGFDYVTHT